MDKNKALSFRNHDKGGRYYVKNATSPTKWTGFEASVIEKLKKSFGVDFFLVIWTDEQEENDFFNIPFRKLESFFKDEYKTKGKHPNRWTVSIKGKEIKVFNTDKWIDIKDDYGNLHEDNISEIVNEDLSAYKSEVEYFEGKQKLRLSSYHERNSRLRTATIKAQGLVCKVCGFNFKKFYGTLGEDYIEVHHLIPVSKLNPSQKICHISDMAVVCANCHRMFHRRKDQTLTIDQLKALLKK